MTIFTCDQCEGRIIVSEVGVVFEVGYLASFSIASNGVRSAPECSKCSRLCDELHHLINGSIHTDVVNENPDAELEQRERDYADGVVKA